MANIKLPVDFEEKIKTPASNNGSGYPYRISASDLMKNFSYSALDAESDWIEQSNVGVYEGRKLKLPQFPGSGTFVLGCINGRLQWIATEEC